MNIFYSWNSFSEVSFCFIVKPNLFFVMYLIGNVLKFILVGLFYLVVRPEFFSNLCKRFLLYYVFFFNFSSNFCILHNPQSLFQNRMCEELRLLYFQKWHLTFCWMFLSVNIIESIILLNICNLATKCPGIMKNLSWKILEFPLIFSAATLIILPSRFDFPLWTVFVSWNLIY